MCIHKYIRKSNNEDSAFEIAEKETYKPESSISKTNNRDGEGNADDMWIAKRDDIVANIT